MGSPASAKNDAERLTDRGVVQTSGHAALHRQVLRRMALFNI